VRQKEYSAWVTWRRLTTSSAFNVCVSTFLPALPQFGQARAGWERDFSLTRGSSQEGFLASGGQQQLSDVAVSKQRQNWIG
jgi:hypothetical protein